MMLIAFERTRLALSSATFAHVLQAIVVELYARIRACVRACVRGRGRGRGPWAVVVVA